MPSTMIALLDAAPNADIGDGCSRRRTLALRSRRRHQADLAKPDLLDAREERSTSLKSARTTAAPAFANASAVAKPIPKAAPDGFSISSFIRSSGQGGIQPSTAGRWSHYLQASSNSGGAKVPPAMKLAPWVRAAAAAASAAIWRVHR
jgi:hypothetical protein